PPRRLTREPGRPPPASPGCPGCVEESPPAVCDIHTTSRRVLSSCQGRRDSYRWRAEPSREARPAPGGGWRTLGLGTARRIRGIGSSAAVPLAPVSDDHGFPAAWPRCVLARLSW